MIPSKLRLKNFMCYRGSENEIDFSGIHLACLAGDNGQGKSALLDAMTWALWGKARTNSADALITYGESEMEVRFEFDLSGTRYRVVRQRTSTGRGSSELQLQAQLNGGFFSPLSDSTIRATQRKINKLLRLDYDTFVNSAFLLQGRADEFTTKRPGERKRILADILGLAQYDEFAKRARVRSREAETRREGLEAKLKEIRKEVEKIPRYEAELIDAEAEAKRSMAQLREANEAHQALLDQRRELDAKQDARTQAERRVKAMRGELANTEAKLHKRRQQVARFDALLARADEIEAAMAELTQARQDNERWNDLLQQSNELRHQASEIQREIDSAKGELEKQLSGLNASIKNHARDVKRHGKREEELAGAQNRVEQLERIQQEQDERQRLLMQWREASGRLGAENEHLRNAMQDLRERMNLLESSEAATCPVCRQPLSPAGRAEALEEAQAEGTSMGDHYRENDRAQEEARQRIATLEEQSQRAERQLKELKRWQRLAAEAAQAAKEQRRAQQALAAEEERAAALRARLEAGDYAQEAQAKLAELAEANQSLGYDREQHEAAKKTIQHLAPREKEHRELERARQQRENVVEMVEMLAQQVRAQKKRIAEEEETIQRLTEELRGYDALKRRIHEQQVRKRRLEKESAEAQRHEGGARQKLRFAEQQAARQPEVEQEHHAAVEERTIYKQLANAFGRRGVQAMIIESAIPEIEQEANGLLGRMTDGRMSISLQTQREAKSTDATIETLDILISDEHGERPYETFSGGEAFRVNFALRIALSTLLAHRAGTNLRTLVIDEGFGSQDAQGRDRLVEAITSVQEDFERILVITHIDELKDAFPVRIDVVKGPEGSGVTVS